MSKREVTHVINKNKHWLRKPCMNHCYNPEWLRRILEPDTKIKIDHIKAHKTWEKYYEIKELAKLAKIAKIAELAKIEDLKKRYIELYNHLPKGCKTNNIEWLINEIKKKEDEADNANDAGANVDDSIQN